MAVKEEHLLLLGAREDISRGYLMIPLRDTERAKLLYNTRDVDYDPSESEILAMDEASRQTDRAEAQIASVRDTSVGSIVRPKYNTLGGYQFVLRQQDGVRGIEFNQDTYGIFDGIVVQNVGADSDGKSRVAAFNSENPLYNDYQPLRRNIAILRNYLLCDAFPEGLNPIASRTEDEWGKLADIQEMADRLGKAMASQSGGTDNVVDRWKGTVKNLVTGNDLAATDNKEFIEACNIPDKGAQVMYDYLLGLHKAHHIMGFISKNTPKEWNLKEREDTIFSDENYMRFGRANRMKGISEAYDNNVLKPLSDVDGLSPQDLNTSVALAREIIEKLKNMRSNPADRENKAQFTDDKMEEARMLLSASFAYKEALAELAGVDRNLLQDERFAAAYEAMRTLSSRMKSQTVNMFEEEKEPFAAKQKYKELEETPERYKGSPATTDALIEKVDTGLKAAAEKIAQHQAAIAAKQSARAARRAAQQAARQHQQNSAQTFSQARVRSANKGPLADKIKKRNDEPAQQQGTLQPEDPNAPFLSSNSPRTR